MRRSVKQNVRLGVISPAQLQSLCPLLQMNAIHSYIESGELEAIRPNPKSPRTVYLKIGSVIELMKKLDMPFPQEIVR